MVRLRTDKYIHIWYERNNGPREQGTRATGQGTFCVFKFTPFIDTQCIFDNDNFSYASMTLGDMYFTVSY